MAELQVPFPQNEGSEVAVRHQGLQVGATWLLCLFHGYDRAKLRCLC